MAASGNISTLAVSNASRRLTVEETRQLVFQMGVPLNDLDDIADEYKGENRKQHYLGKWLNMDPNASWDKLAVGLKEINMNALASEIESEHQLSRPLIPSIESSSLLTTSSTSFSAPPVVNTPGYQDTLSTPAPVGSLPPAPPTATTALISSFPPPPLTGTPAPVSFVPPAPLTTTPAPVCSLPPAPLTANPAPFGSLPPPPLTATLAPAGSLPPTPLTATPSPVGSLPPAPLTATPAPVGSLPAAPLTATPASIGSLPAAPLTPTPASVGSLPPTPLIATPPPVGSFTHPSQPSVVFQQRVEEARYEIEHFEEDFSDLKYEAQDLLSEKQAEDPKFVKKFQNKLLDMPVTKKQIHIRFFTRNEDEILNAKTIQKLFAILSRYCNYSNYEIILHIVKKFCHHELKGKMLKYRDSLTSFEKATTIDVYLCAISAHPGGEISQGFIRMTMKINKQPSECTLYEIRVLKESIEEKASLESYAMYIETPEEGSVCVRLLIPWEVHSLVAAVLTAEFRREHLLTEVTVKKWAVQKFYLVRCYVY